MLIDCDTCTVRGTGCADCVVTVLLGAPSGWRGADPAVVRLAPRGPALPAESSEDLVEEGVVGDGVVAHSGVLVDFDDVERRAVRALAEGGLVPPLRHRSPATLHPRTVTESKHKTG